jgi:hypothetical protein
MKRLWAAASVGIFSTAILLYLWWGKFQYDHSLYLLLTYLLCSALVISNHFIFRDGRRTLGLRLDNRRAASRSFGSFTVLAWGGLLAAGLVWGELDDYGWRGLAVYPVWAAAQQYLLQNFLRLRLEGALGAGVSPGWDPSLASAPWDLPRVVAAVLTAALFAVFHIPNWPLTVLTLFGGVAWCLLFSAVPNLPWAWLSQTVLGLTLILFFKQGGLGQFEVGAPGFRYEGYGDGVQVAGGFDETGRPFLATLPGPDRGTQSMVRVFSVDGALRETWEAFPEYGFSGRLAVGDLGLTEGDEIVVVPGPGASNPPLVRVFDLRGRRLAEFLAPLPGGYGAAVAVACGGIYLCPGPGPGAPQTVWRLSPKGRVERAWNFTGMTRFVNGLNARPVPGTCSEEEEELLLWGTSVSVNPAEVVTVRRGEATVLEVFPATYGLTIAPVAFRGAWGVAASPGPLVGYPRWVRIFSVPEIETWLRDFVPFDDPGAAGANLASLDVDGDGNDELVMGEGSGRGRPPRVRILKLDGTILYDWLAF